MNLIATLRIFWITIEAHKDAVFIRGNPLTLDGELVQAFRHTHLLKESAFSVNWLKRLIEWD